MRTSAALTSIQALSPADCADLVAFSRSARRLSRSAGCAAANVHNESNSNDNLVMGAPWRRSTQLNGPVYEIGRGALFHDFFRMRKDFFEDTFRRQWMICVL